MRAVLGSGQPRRGRRCSRRRRPPSTSASSRSPASTSPGTPAQVRPRRDPQDRAARARATSSCSTPARRPAPPTSRRSPRRSCAQAQAGRSGRSSAARTCSRTSRCSTAPRPGKATPQQVFDYYLGWLTDPSISPHFQLIPDAEVGYARAVGHERRDRGPAPRRAAGADARRQGRASAATRSAARSRPRTRRGTSAASRARRASSGLVFIDGGSGPTPVTPDRRAAVAHGARRPARRGSPSAASRRRSPASSTRPARSACCSTRTRRRSARLPAAAGEPQAAGAR